MLNILCVPLLQADKILLKKRNTKGKDFFVEGIVIQEDETNQSKAYKTTLKSEVTPESNKRLKRSPLPIIKPVSQTTVSTPFPTINNVKPIVAVPLISPQNSKDKIEEKAADESPKNKISKAEEKPNLAEVVNHNTSTADNNTKSTFTTKAKHQTTSIGLGINYSFPMIHYQFAVSKHFTVGFSGILIDYSTTNHSSLKGYGGLLSLNYYDSDYFEGLWIEAGGGLYQLNLSDAANRELKTIQSLIGHLGWRWKWDAGPSFAFAAGAQYLLGLTSNNINLAMNGFFPSLIVEIAFVF